MSPEVVPSDEQQQQQQRPNRKGGCRVAFMQKDEQIDHLQK